MGQLINKDTQVIVQGLLRRSDRRKSIETEMEILGFTNIIYINSLDAVEYNLKSEKEIAYFKTRRMPAGYVANHATRSLIFQFLDNIDLGESVLFVEDDAVFPRNFWKEIPSICNSLPDSFDCVNFGCKECNITASKKVNAFLYRPGYPVHSHCILYSKKGIKKIANILRSFHNTFDMQICDNLYNIEYYSSYNILVKQAPELNPSDGNK